MQPVIEIKNGTPRHPLYRMKEPVNFSMERGEHIALVGPNGGGKSLLVDILMGRWPLLMNEVNYNFSSSDSELVCDNIKYIAFRDSYGDADGNYYYQQRWNSQDMEITPIVGELLPVAKDESLKEQLFHLFNIAPLLDKHIVLLSSGELRKFQLVKSLLGNPRILILDNPFIGLDKATREMLQNLLKHLIDVIGLQVILVLSKINDIPDFITHVVPVEERLCKKKVTLSDYLNTSQPIKYDIHILDKEKRTRILNLPQIDENINFEEVIQLNKVSVRYDDRIILKDLDWTVMCGEKWALTGDMDLASRLYLASCVLIIRKVMHVIFLYLDVRGVLEKVFGK